MKTKLTFIVLLVFLSACSSPNNLSEPIVCDSPYIRFEAGCCLDKNKNSICDVDETQVVQEDMNKAVAEKEDSSDSFKTLSGTELTSLEQEVFNPENECASGEDWKPVRLYGEEEFSFEGFKNEFRTLWQKALDGEEEVPEDMFEKFSTFDKYWQSVLEEVTSEETFRINPKTGYVESCG